MTQSTICAHEPDYGESIHLHWGKFSAKLLILAGNVAAMLISDYSDDDGNDGSDDDDNDDSDFDSNGVNRVGKLPSVQEDLLDSSSAAIKQSSRVPRLHRRLLTMKKMAVIVIVIATAIRPRC